MLIILNLTLEMIYLTNLKFIISLISLFSTFKLQQQPLFLPPQLQQILQQQL